MTTIFRQQTTQQQMQHSTDDNYVLKNKRSDGKDVVLYHSKETNTSDKYVGNVLYLIDEKNSKFPAIAIHAIGNSLNKFYEGVSNGTLKNQKDIQAHFQTTENYLSKATKYEAGQNPNFSVDKDGNVVLSIGNDSYAIPKDFKKANIESTQKMGDVVQKYAKALESANPKDKKIMLDAAKNLGLHVSYEKDGDMNISAGYSTAHIKNLNLIDK